MGFLEELEEHMTSDTTWAVYLYMCGSDLERDYGAASADIDAIVQTNFSPNIKFVIQTGGSSRWDINSISSNKLGRYVVENQNLYRVQELPGASMGAPETLSSFLKFCRSEYPADREILIIWDHGGGVCYDEIYNNDCLTIPEVRQALSLSMNANAAQPPLEFAIFTPA